MVPRYGPMFGGTSIYLSGQNLSRFTLVGYITLLDGIDSEFIEFEIIHR